MEFLIPLILCLLIVAPLVALVLAIHARNRAEDARLQVLDLSRRLARLEQELRSTRGAVERGSSAAPVSEQPEDSARSDLDQSSQGAADTEPRSIATRPPPPSPLAPPIASAARTFAAASVPPVLPEPLGGFAPSSAADTPTEPARPAVPAQPPDSAPPAEPAPPAARSFEEDIGARVYVWIGALALALAGVFLVKYSIERGLLSPFVRVLLGAVFGLALLVVGERWRGRNLGAAATSAGIADLFACLLAAVHLYGLIGPAVGFALMIAITAAAVLLSLRQGPAVALLGLAGGFVTPALIGGEEPHPLPLFGWFLVLQAALLYTGRKQGWSWLGLLSVACGLGWALLWLVGPFGGADEAWLAPFVLCSAALAAWAGISAREPATRDGSAAALVWLGPAAGIALLGLQSHLTHYSVTDWTYVAVACAGLLALARLREQHQGLAWLSAAAALAILFAASQSDEFDRWRFAWAALVLGALHAFVAYACLYRSTCAASWASLAVAALATHMLLAWWRLRDDLPLPLPWSIMAAIASILCAAGAWPLWKRYEGEVASAVSPAPSASNSQIAGALGALAVGTSGMLALAFGFGLKREWIAVAWALEIPVLAWLYRSLRLRPLTGVALVLGAAVVARLLLNPAVFDYPTGSRPVFNWLLYGYGLPAACLAGAASIFGRAQARFSASACACTALALSAASCALELRHGFHAGRIDRGDVILAEAGAIGAAWLLCAFLALRVELGWPNGALRTAALMLAGFTLAAGGPYLLFGKNPIREHVSVGEHVVFNGLLVAYGLPALMSGLLARDLSRRALRGLSILAAIASIGAGFMLISLEVRQGFRGAYLDEGIASSAELYAYSAAWIVYGALLLGAGIATRGPILRWASLVVMMLAIGKVFLYDMRELRDLWRVASFLGLGVCALGVGWLYQRYVFPRSRGS